MSSFAPRINAHHGGTHYGLVLQSAILRLHDKGGQKDGGGQLIFSKRMGMSEKTSKLWENKEKSTVDTIHTAKNLAKFTRKKGADFVLILIYF